MFETEDQRSGAVYYGRGAKPSGDDYMDMLERRQDAEGLQRSEHPLDTPQAQATHGLLMGHYTRELERQSENRLAMAADEDFYDHIQWSAEELAALAERGQAPLIFNLIQTTVNWVLGTQRRSTADYRILPRVKEGAQAAERKTEVLKIQQDENRSEYEWADAFGDAIKAGVGWMETGEGNPEDGPRVFDRRENWRSMLWDSLATSYDLTDARYVSRTKWLDLDTATALWPTRRGLLEMSASDVVGGLYDGDDNGDEAMDSLEAAHFDSASTVASAYSAERPRVRCVEMWFKRMNPRAQVVRGGQFSGELFDPWSPGHYRDLSTGRASLAVVPRETVHVALMTDGGLLDLRNSPYRHNRYPFTPLWAYRRARDGMPYGMIRGLRDIQRDLNKRASKALHHLSAVRVIAQEGSLSDPEQTRAEAGRPDAMIFYKQGYAPPAIETDLNLASAHIDLMSRDAQMIQSVGGVTDENLGRRTNATSGIAIERRQDQGQLATGLFFDNLRRSRQIHGEKTLVNIEQFYTSPEEMLIEDARGNPQFISINDGKAENAIAEFKAKFVLSEEDWRATVRQAQAEALLDLAAKLAATAPMVVVQILDLVVEAMDVPKREEFVKRIRQITGAPDPDADPNNPDPETVAREQAKAAEAAMQQRLAEAEIAAKEGQARKLIADAMRAETGAATDTLAQLKAALEAAVAIAGAPAVAAAADQILSEARAAAGLTPMDAPPAPPMQEAPMQEPEPQPQQPEGTPL